MDNITVEKIILKSSDLELKAELIKANNNNEFAILLIPGSGPVDIDSSIGTLKPLKVLANKLAQKGLSVFRFEKRTFTYPESFTSKSTINDEYINDCEALISTIINNYKYKNVILIGHSLGGQIATFIAVNNVYCSKVCLLNSSARHLADIACDQYVRIDLVNANEYRFYADKAKNSTQDSVLGYFYYGATDNYWVSYNKIDVLAIINKIKKPILIINSKNDRQSFESDLNLWSDIVEKRPDILYYKDEIIDHFMFEYTNSQADIPDRLIDLIADFIVS